MIKNSLVDENTTNIVFQSYYVLFTPRCLNDQNH